MVKDSRLYILQILKWTFIGLLIRFILMPFTMHTMDIIFINYFPHKLVTAGVWNPYSFMKNSFPDFGFQYYPPLTHFIFAFFQALLKPFTGNSMNGFYDKAAEWVFGQHGYTAHYTSVLLPYQLFRNSFILKFPYLIFDFSAAWLLVKLVSDRRRALLLYKLWMLNPVVLYSCYAIGQYDILLVFFLMLTVYSVTMRKNYYLAVMFLVMGGAVKTLPFLFIPFVVIIGSRNMREKIYLAVWAIGLLLLIYLPLYLSSQGEVIRSMSISSTVNMPEYISSLRNINIKSLFSDGLLLAGYLFLLFVSFIFAKKSNKEQYIMPLFAVSILLFFDLMPITFRYFVWLTPFLFFYIPKNKLIGFLAIFLIVILSIIKIYGNQLQWALFSPLSPEFFSSIPAVDNIWAANLPFLWVHRILYRLFVIGCLFTAYLIYRNEIKVKTDA